MAELTPTERLQNTRELLERTKIKVAELRTFEELDDVMDIVFGEIQDLENRIKVLENHLDIVEMTISTTNGR